MKEEPPAMNDLRYLTGKESFIVEDVKRWKTKIENVCKFRVLIEFSLSDTLCDLTKKDCSYSYCPTLELLKTINPRGWSNG